MIVTKSSEDAINANIAPVKEKLDGLLCDRERGEGRGERGERKRGEGE